MSEAEPDEFDEVPRDDDRAWVLDELGALVRAAGPARFLEAPLALPTGDFFPDPWTGDESSVEALARRTLGHAGFGDFAVVVSRADLMFDGHAIWLEDLDHEVCRLRAAIGELGDDPGGRMALVAGAAFRRALGLTPPEVAARANDPRAADAADAGVRSVYREAVAVDEDAVELEGQRADLASVYVGLGVIAANHGFKQARVQGRYAHVVAERRRTYLPPRMMAFALAAQVVARDLGFWERRKLAGHLDVTPASYFRASFDLLHGDASSLRARLLLDRDRG